jgi:thioester reductase-like protein
MAQSHQSLDAKATIAVAGATGDLGTRLMDGFLADDLRDGPAGIIALVRKRSDKTHGWEKLGAEIRIIDGSSSEQELVMALEGVDVLVNA